MNVDALLSRLEKVRRTGPENWIACCPSHEDRNPSMTIRETGEGVLLVHCFAGCSIESILTSVGMDASDLFPERSNLRHSSPPLRNRFPARDVLECVANEAMIVAIVARAISDQKPVPVADLDRCRIANVRIHEAIHAIE